MKSLTILLAACLLVGAAPLAGAAEACVSKAPREETLPHPLKPGIYIVLDTDAPEKTGEWEDRNGRTGIQTDDCMTLYKKDKQHAFLP